MSADISMTFTFTGQETPFPAKAWADGLQDLVDAGTRAHAALSGLTPEQIQAAMDSLPDWGSVWARTADDVKRHKRQQRDLRERQRWNKKRRRR